MPYSVGDAKVTPHQKSLGRRGGGSWTVEIGGTEHSVMGTPFGGFYVSTGAKGSKVLAMDTTKYKTYSEALDAAIAKGDSYKPEKPSLTVLKKPAKKEQTFEEVLAMQKARREAKAKTAPPSTVTVKGSKNGQTYTLSHSGRTVVAKDSSGAVVGQLATWNNLQGKDSVFKTAVNEKHRRQGLATAMFDLAKQHEPELVQATELSEDGKAWADALEKRQKKG